jgi:hypothetical protein
MLAAGVVFGLLVLGIRLTAHAAGPVDGTAVRPRPADPSALPFSDAELQQALLARLLPSADAPGPPGAHLAPAGPGAVSVRVGGQTRVVVIGERTGAAAARVVALVIAELLSAGAPEAATTPAGAPALRPEEPTAAPPTLRENFRPALPDGPSVWRLAVTGGASKGFASDELAAATLDADLMKVRPDSRWRLSPSLGLTFIPTRNAGTLDEVSFVSGLARLLGGTSRGPVDVLAGPFGSAYAIGGATTHSGLLVGGEAMARVTAPLSPSLRLAAEVRVDGYANRVRVLWADGGAYATPRVGVGVGVGLAWDRPW